MRASLFLILVVLLLAGLLALAFLASDSTLPAELASVEGVKAVQPVSTFRPKCTIIHIADYHHVSRSELKIELRYRDPETTDADVEEEFQRIVAIAKKVQANQLRVIRWLAKKHGVRAIHIEGLTDRDRELYGEVIRTASEGEDGPVKIGAAGQALLAGDIQSILPAEDEAAFEAAIAVSEKGFRFDAVNDAREAAIVRRLAESGPLAIVVLGVAHDLSSHAKALSCDYVKVYVDGLPERWLPSAVFVQPPDFLCRRGFLCKAPSGRGPG